MMIISQQQHDEHCYHQYGGCDMIHVSTRQYFHAYAEPQICAVKSIFKVHPFCTLFMVETSRSILIEVTLICSLKGNKQWKNTEMFSFVKGF